MYADQNTREMAPLLNGHQLRVLKHEKKGWFPAKVISQIGDRSYCVQRESGLPIRFYRSQLREIIQTTGQITLNQSWRSVQIQTKQWLRR